MTGAALLLFTYIYLNKDLIKQQIIVQLNNYVNTQVEVKHIDLELLEKFPLISLSFKDVKVKGSDPEHQSTLMSAKELLCTFDIWDILEQKYNIHQLYIDEANIHMLVDENGDVNYNVIKTNSKTETETDRTDKHVSLKSVIITSANFKYENQYKQQWYHLNLPKIEGDFTTQDLVVRTAISGKAFINGIQLDTGNVLLKNKELLIDSKISYDLSNKQLSLKNSTFSLNKSEFLLDGGLQIDSTSFINLTIKAKESKISSLVSLVPNKLSQNLNQYQSSGNIRFDAHIIGEISTQVSPKIDVSFGCSNLALTHPETKLKIHDLNLSGKFTTESNGNLELESFKGKIDHNEIDGAFSLNNFKDPYLKAHLHTAQNLYSCLKLAHVQNINSANGIVGIFLNIDGKLSDFQNKTFTASQIHAKVRADVNEITFNNQKKLSNTQLRLHLKNSDLVVDTLHGSYENSDFKIEGGFKNFLQYVLGKTDLLDLEGSLTSEKITLNDFYKPEKKDTTKSILNLPSNMMVVFKSKIKELNYNNLMFKNFKGQLKITPKNIDLNDVHTQLAGGVITLKANINTLHQANPRIDATIELKKIHIDTTLHLFNNFDQHFITYENLKGQLSTKVYINCSLDKYGNILPESIFSNIDLAISNGRLINFEPMQKMAKFINEKELADIKFSELKNSFHIENNTVYVPEMIIKSNLNTLTIMGTHNLTNTFNYRLKVNLKRKKKDSDEKFGAVEQDASGNMQVLLKINGDGDKVNVSYDKDAVKTKVKDSWKDEKQEFKDLFKKQAPKPEENKNQIDTEKDLIDLE